MAALPAFFADGCEAAHTHVTGLALIRGQARLPQSARMNRWKCGGWPIGGSGLSSRDDFSRSSSSCVAPDPSPRRPPTPVSPVYANGLGLTSCVRAAALRQGPARVSRNAERRSRRGWDPLTKQMRLPWKYGA